MKILKAATLLAFLTVCKLPVFAQDATIPLNLPVYGKAKIFGDLPDKMPLRITDAEQLLDLPVGAKVSTNIASGLPVAGVVVSKSNPADTSVKSVVVRTNRQGATFIFSRTIAADGTVSFRGHMFNRSGGDALEIVKEGEGYVIRKKGLNELLNE
jgi:hypothetical protein